MNPTDKPDSNDTDMGYDPFRPSRLFPEKWDLSELIPAHKAPKKSEPLPSWYEPFHFPKTIPTGWSLNEKSTNHL